MYILNFTLHDWHKGLEAGEDNPEIYGIAQEHLSEQIRIYLDLEDNVTYTLDFKSAGRKWFRVMGKGEGYLYYTLQADDMKRKYFDMQLVATYEDGSVKKTPVYRGGNILSGINATDFANNKEAAAFREILIELGDRITEEESARKNADEKKADKIHTHDVTDISEWSAIREAIITEAVGRIENGNEVEY